MKVGLIYKKNMQAYESGSRLIVNQGGTSSGKSYSILQLLFTIAQKSNEPLIITVVSQSLPHLKLGVIRDFKNILHSAGIVPDDVWMKTDNIFTIHKSTIEFWSTDNVGKVHGPRRDILFINECNNIPFDIFTQLEIRTRQSIFLDFNPVKEFWFHDNILGKVEFEWIKSTYIDNLFFLDKNIVTSIESKRHIENWWKIYGLGELGVYEGIIFPNWKYGEFNNDLPYCHALDFGFNPDPDCLIKIAVDKSNKRIYVQEKLYNNGNSTGVLIQKLKTILQSSELIIADSAEPRLIGDIWNAGLNIKAAVKNQIAVDIKTIQEYEIIVSPESFNIGKELNNYVWNDKKSGIPIDAFNHSLDPLRYGFNKLTSKQKVGLSI